MTRGPSRLLLRALRGETLPRPPWWLMRQAGRYLPEYRETRAKAGDFVALCLTPSLASEVTLQPVRRYGMDAAILFSDILLVPYALGQELSFSGDGPVLEPIEDAAGLRRLAPPERLDRLDPVLETVRRTRGVLTPETALIGFAGAPWTVATYMVEGGGSKDFRRVKSWAYRDPAGFETLIAVLVEATVRFLSAQIRAGADVVQLFDSWAGALSETGFERWVIAPTRRIVAALKGAFPDCPIIGFPRGAGLLYQRYAAETGVDAVGLDTAVPPAIARDYLQARVAVQGNLDPVLLIAGGAPLIEAATALRRTLGSGPYVFNLGHGVLPQTPPENVARLARLLAEPVT
ncbi:MAG: uroporphyrinogen decarboxylase [Alphaproteobacteria bacterium]|nr:uroporphyrinogen decarboxylase [Alphaproteobacteria bacterium]